jgi:hypothetical protein
MLLAVAALALLGWFLGVLGMYESDALVHVLLVVGLLLLLAAAVKAARDANDVQGKKPSDHI